VYGSVTVTSFHLLGILVTDKSITASAEEAELCPHVKLSTEFFAVEAMLLKKYNNEM
jgi:hypothetical protein